MTLAEFKEKLPDIVDELIEGSAYCRYLRRLGKADEARMGSGMK